MTTFNNQNLFSSGPHTFAIGGITLRHALHESPGSHGAQLSGLGERARTIHQTGDLLGDSPADLRTKISAIEKMVDGQAYVLIDHLGESWSDTAMIKFEPEAVTRMGQRYRVSYRIAYLQLNP